MPQPLASPQVSGPRGNSAKGEFKLKRWQTQDRCGICSTEFSLLNKRHHCRSCGLSVCGRHSKNRVIIPTSLSKTQQRVCDSCYPKCRNGMAMELASPGAPVRQDLPADDVRRHTLVLQDECNNGRRIRSPPDAMRREVQEGQRDRNDNSNRTWNSDDEPIRMTRRDEETRAMQSVRVRRIRPSGAQSPHGRDPREVVSSRGRSTRDGDLHFGDLSNDKADSRRKRDPRDRERRNRDPRERDPRERDPRAKDPRARDPRARDPRDRDPRARDPRERDPRERDPRDRDPRERDPRERDPRERDPRERDLRARDLRAKDPRERDPRERDLRARDLRARDPRERDIRDKDPRERDRRTRDSRERDQRRNDPREKDPRERERRKKDLRERDPFEKERRDRNPRAKDPRERERPRDRALHERDLFDVAPSEKNPRDFSGQTERRHRVLNSEPIRRQTNKKLFDIASSSERGNQRSETSSTCRTSSSTLSSFYAAVNAADDIKPKTSSPKLKSKRLSSRKEKEVQSAFADSTFSIFSLAGSDHSDSESKPRKNAVQKSSSRRRGESRSNSANRVPMEKKEHLDFSASSSSVKCFEVSAITQKYLNPKPASAAIQKASLKPMTEEENESEDSIAEPSRRNVRPLSQDKYRSKSRGKEQSKEQMLPSYKRDRPVDESFRDSGELLQEHEKPSDENTDSSTKRSLSISDDNGFQATQLLLSSDKCNSNDDNDDDDDDAFVANREKQDLAAKLRAKKAAIAGIEPASLDAKEKAPTTANYKLTKRDQEMMQQISELEAVVLQHSHDLLDLLDMYSEATKRAQNAQKGLKKAKVRVARYEKAHAAVARAICSGKLYMKQKEYMAAILELSRAIGIERSNATLWYLLAECRLMVSQPAAAEEACMTCLKLYPTGAAVALLGRILHERGRRDEAIECYFEALGRNDESESDDESEYL